MAKKRDNPQEESDGTRGLSQGAWVAIGTIGAALITAIVALLTHMLPQTSPSPMPTPTPIAAAARAAPTPPLRSTSNTADAIAGKWAGTAKNSEGTSFEITLDVRKSCALSERCGSISVSHVPCEGEVFLEDIQDGNFEFRVANFYGKSNRAVCQPGAGEIFKLRSDGKLAYAATYEPGTQGVLERIASE